MRRSVWRGGVVEVSTTETAEGPHSVAAADHGRDLTVGSIPRHLIAFSLPMLVGSALQTAYSFVNAIWVGRCLGTDSLAAVTVSMPVVFALVAIGGGLTMAANILMSQYYGAKQFGELRKVVDTSTVLIAVTSVVFLVIGEVFAPSILRAIGTPDRAFDLAVSYMRVYLISLPFMFGLFLARNTLQGIGDSKTPLYFVAVSVVLTALLDPLLMLGWRGVPSLHIPAFPRIGLNGTAWAATSTQIAALIVLMWYLHRRKSITSPTWTRLRFDWGTAAQTILIGAPTAIQQFMFSMGQLIVMKLVNSFGETATAAFGAAMRIDMIAFMPAMTLMMAIATLAGQNIGAGKLHRIRAVVFWGLVFSCGVTLLGSALAVGIPGILLRIFTKDPEVVRLGVGYLRIVGAGYMLFAIMFVTNGVINGAGHTHWTTITSLLSMWAVRLPLAYYLVHRMHSLNAIWYAMVIAFFISMLLSLIYYWGGWWRRPILGRRSAPMTETAMLGEEMAEC